MSSVKRRVNSTGRKRIKRDSVDIKLQPDETGRPVAAITVKLNEYAFPANARVIVEAYYKSSSIKVVWGAVGSTVNPLQMRLSELDNPAAALFRVKVVADGGSGAILGSAERLRPNGADEADGRKSIFPIRECDLGHELWRVDIDDDAGPVLMLNNQIVGFKYRVLENPLIGGVLLSAAFRKVLEYLVEHPDYEDEDAEHWKPLWFKYLREQFGVDDDISALKDDDAEIWVKRVVQNFCEWRAFIQKIRLSAEGDFA